MIIPIIWVLLVAAGLGLGAVYLTRGSFSSKTGRGISWPVFAGALVVCLIVGWLSVLIGFKISFQNAVTYHENWGGYEVKADYQTFDCYESSSEGGSTGGCNNTFNADSYTELESYECGGTEGTGKDAHYVSKTCYRTVTKYRQVPYTTTETNWVIHTTLGDYTVGDHWLTENPNQHRIRARDGSIDSIPGGLQSGTPQIWSQADARIKAGDPGPVTKRMDYDNYILASQQTILKKYSASIDRLKAAGLLPKIEHDTRAPYYADRVYFVGAHAAGDWQWAINRFDAALGANLQGDMHLVIVDSTKVDPDEYIGALGAYWQSPEMGKDALSKNGIIVVIGTADGGKTVDWARASTGMPVGNEAMLLDVKDALKGAPLTPDNILGHPVASFYIEQVKQPDGSVKDKQRIRITNGSGLLEKVMWGPNKFQRVCMSCTTAGDKGTGYNYLANEIQPKFWAKFWMVLVATLINAALWAGLSWFLVGGSGGGFGGGSGLRSSRRRSPFDSSSGPFRMRRSLM